MIDLVQMLCLLSPGSSLKPNFGWCSSLALLIPHCSCSFGSLLFLFLLITVLVTFFILVVWTPKQSTDCSYKSDLWTAPFGNKSLNTQSSPDVFLSPMNSQCCSQLTGVPSACWWTHRSCLVRVSLVNLLGPSLSSMIWTMALEKRSVGRPHLDVRGDNILSQATG